MELFCVGEQFFCDFFAWAGVDYAVCENADEAALCIESRLAGNEIVLVSGSIAGANNRALERLFNDPSRIVIPIPSPSGETGFDAKSVFQHLLGGGA